MKYVLWIFVLCLCVPRILVAQELPADLSIDVVPTNPQPGSIVTLTARSYSLDINQASLSWTYNGKVVESGMGKKTIQIIAPAAGIARTITVSLSGSGGEGANSSVIIRPGSIDLLWEAADAYTPPFYKGKALLPIGGLLRVTALPSATAPRNLSFDWDRNNSALDTASGFNKTSILLKHNPLNPQEKISVSVETGTFTGSGSLELAPFAPIAIAYENTDGYINYSQGYRDTIRMNKPGSLLHFEPYYFSVPIDLQRDLSTTISVNGETIATEQSNEFAVSRPETGTQSTFDLTVTTTEYTLQHLKKTFTLLFN